MAFFKKEMIDNCWKLEDVGTESNHYIVLDVSHIKYLWGSNFTVTILIVRRDGEYNRLIDIETRFFDDGGTTEYIKAETKRLVNLYGTKKVIIDSIGFGIMAVDALKSEDLDIVEVKSTPSSKIDSFLKLASDINKSKLLIISSKLNYKFVDLVSELKTVDIEKRKDRLKIVGGGVKFDTLLTFYEYLIKTENEKEQKHKDEQEKTNNEYKAKVTLEFDVLPHDKEIKIERLADILSIKDSFGYKILNYLQDYDYAIVLPHNLRVNGKIEYFDENNKAVAVKEINHHLLKTDIKEALKEMDSEEVVNALKEAGYKVIKAENGHFIVKEN